MGAFNPESRGAESVSGSVIACFTVVGVVLLQLGFEYLETIVANHQHTSHMLRSAYRELASMGIVAFVMFAIQTAGALPDKSAALYEFESMHVMLFILAITFLLCILALVGLSLQVAAQWDTIESSYAFDITAYSGLKQRLLETQMVLGVRQVAAGQSVSSGGWRVLQLVCCCQWRTTAANTLRRDSGNSTPVTGKTVTTEVGILHMLRHPLLFIEYMQLMNKVRFLEQRYQFLRRNDLPGDFSFTAYLRKAKHHAFKRLVHLPVKTWMGLSLAIMIDMYVRAAWQWYNDNVGPPVFVVGCTVGVFVLAVAVFAKIRAVHWAVLHSSYLPPRLPTMDNAAYRDACVKAQRALFWFGHPVFLLRCMQGVIFGGAFVVAVAARFWFEFEEPGKATIPIVVMVVVIVSTYMMRTVVPLFIICLHTGELVDLRLLVEAVEKQRQVTRERRRQKRETLLASHVTLSSLQKINSFLLSDAARKTANSLILADFLLICINVSHWLPQPHYFRMFTVQVALTCLSQIFVIAKAVVSKTVDANVSKPALQRLGTFIELLCISSSTIMTIIAYILYRNDDFVPTISLLARPIELYTTDRNTLLFLSAFVLGGLFPTALALTSSEKGEKKAMLGLTSIKDVTVAADTGQIAVQRINSSGIIQLPVKRGSSFLSDTALNLLAGAERTDSSPTVEGQAAADMQARVGGDAATLDHILGKLATEPAYRSDLVEDHAHKAVYSDATLTEAAARVLASRLATTMLHRPQRSSFNLTAGMEVPAQHEQPAHQAQQHPAASVGPMPQPADDAALDTWNTLTPAQRAELARVANLIGNDACQMDGVAVANSHLAVIDEGVESDDASSTSSGPSPRHNVPHMMAALARAPSIHDIHLVVEGEDTPTRRASTEHIPSPITSRHGLATTPNPDTPRTPAAADGAGRVPPRPSETAGDVRPAERERRPLWQIFPQKRPQ